MVLLLTSSKKAWDVIGNDVCKAIKEFFEKGKLLGEVNSTLITLVPKIHNPSKVSDFRPISCCNVVYKCISKILTNRIKITLSKVISPNQSAFIPGRQITDNILLTQEILRRYEWKNGAKRISCKVDIQKSYDIANWNFLETTLTRMGFHSKMVHWIMTCVRTVGFSICVNGDRHGYFKAGRGLRQGDPISPYLFTTDMEVFTIIMKRKIEKCRHFRYHWGCKDLKISHHLCFADDLFALCHGDVASVMVVKEAMDVFSRVSGLIPNFGKSTIFFGNLSEHVKHKILDVMPFEVGQPPVSYLGVPLIAKKNGINECKYLVDKVRSKVFNWKNKILTYAGRLQLIAAVLSSIHFY
jgi:hypothetical protein